MAASRIHDAGLSKEFRAHTPKYTFCLKNICPHAANEQTKYERMYKKRLKMTVKKIWLQDLCFFEEILMIALGKVFTLVRRTIAKIYIIGTGKSDDTLRVTKKLTAMFDEVLCLPKPKKTRKRLNETKFKKDARVNKINLSIQLSRTMTLRQT